MNLLRKEFNKDDGFCYYCQKQYKTPGNWWKHIRTAHFNTIRYWTIKDNIEKQETNGP